MKAKFEFRMVGIYLEYGENIEMTKLKILKL